MSEAEIERLARKHSDIVNHGAGAMERHAAKVERQLQLSAFVLEHGVSCFKCGTRLNQWAKTGITNGRAWAICVPCVRKKGGG